MNPADLAEIARKLHSNQLILFVGSGMSAGCYPTWSDLLKQLVDDLGTYDAEAHKEASAMLEEKQYLDAAWIVERAVGGLPAKLARIFARNFSPDVEQRYLALKDLPFKSIFTTNYDHFLDDGRDPVTPDDRPPETFDPNHVLHLHGRASSPSTMVLTSIDFSRAKFHERLSLVMQAAATAHSFLFLGYSMDDEDVRLWIERCCYLLNTGEARHWALVNGGKWGKYRRMLFEQRYGVKMLDADLTAAEFPDIVGFLGDLREAWTKLRRVPRSETWTRPEESARYVDPVVQGEKQPAIGLDEFIDRWLKEDSRKFLILLGEFGTGKTWFSYRAAELVAKFTKRVPVVVKLGQFTQGADKDTVAAAALSQSEGADFLKANSRGDYVLFLDAFDEMGRPDGMTLDQSFERLRKLVEGNAKVVLTCRKEFFRDQKTEEDALGLAVSAKVIAAGVEKVEVQKFDADKIETALTNRGKRDVFLKIKGNRHMMDLASRPVVLNLIASYRGGFNTSTRSADVYGDYIDELLTRGRPEGLARRRRFAEKLAMEMQKSGAGALHANRVVELAREEDVEDHELSDFYGRSLLVRQVDHFAFGHASFREYLVARQIVPDLERGRLPECTRLSNPTIGFLRELWKWTPPVVEDDGKGMVKVPAGPFICGEGDDARVETIAQDFWIDKYPVTNAQYLAFLRAHPNVEMNWIVMDPKLEADDYKDHPVTGVSWHGAKAYSAWAKKRLPSKLEWEKAARGADGREYPWGDGFDEQRCNTLASGSSGTTRVTAYADKGASPYGCADMAGNVWEWTESGYPEGGKVEDLRGGSWFYIPEYARCAGRVGYYPGYRDSLAGFRCARD